MTLRPLPILVDMDGVLAGFDQAVMDRFGEWLEIDSLDDQHARYITDHVIGTSAQEESERRNKVRRAINLDGWFRSLPVIPGAQEGIERLSALDVEVWVCSKPLITNPHCASEKYAWLGQHFPELQRRLILAPDKSLVRGSVLIDDAPKESWLKNAPSWVPIIYAYPHNEDLQSRYPALTWDTLDDAKLALIRDIAHGHKTWSGFEAGVA